MRDYRPILVSILLGLLLAAGGLFNALIAEQTRWEAPELDLQYVADEEPAPVVEQLGEHLWSVDGLKVVVASGSPREMGRQYGAAVAEDIRRGIDSYLFAHVRDNQGYDTQYMRLCSAAMEKHIAPEYIEEMQGVAEGSGIPYEDILAMHIHADMVHYGHDWGKPRQDQGDGQECSNFAVWGPATADGRLYHGRNLDWTSGTRVQDSAVVYIGIPEQGHAFALVTYAGCVGAVTGMNAAGITFGEMTSSTNDETLDGEPLFIICRRLLQHCGNLSEVEQMVGGYAGTTGWNFVVAAGGERSARAFEVDAGDKIVFGPADEQENKPPVSEGFEYGIYRTNHPVSEKLQRKILARLGIDNLEVARVMVRGLDTWQRYESIRLWVTEKYYGKVDARLARAMLQSKPLAGGGNLHSVVFAPEDLRMWVANATSPPDKQPAYTQKYHLIELPRFVGLRH